MDTTKPETPKIQKAPKNRIIIGAVILIVGFLSPLLIPMVLSSGLSDGLKTVISGGLAFGIPELFMLVAIGIMGKEGFDYLKRYLRLVLKVYGPPERVSKLRYSFGLVLFVLPLLVGFFAPYLLSKREFYIDNLGSITILTDIVLFISLIILGGEFWDKLRSLFVYGAVAVFPKKDKRK